MRVFPDLASFTACAGQTLGSGDWQEIDQARIDLFADATGDHQWIHVDPVKAADGPFGGTIAHGYLTLALLPVLVGSVYRVEKLRMAVNYGLNKVRFPSPVLAGSRVRATSELTEVREIDGGAEITLTTTIEIDGSTKPACVALQVIRYYAG